MKVVFNLLTGGRLPERQTEGSVGYDLFSCVDLEIEPKKVGLINLGFCMEIEVGYEAQIRSRSGFALKNQVFVLNSPGTIDSDYRGEVAVILMNLSDNVFKVSVGDRVAQMVFSKVEAPEMVLSDGLSVFRKKSDIKESRSGGFGSTKI
ncbi:dUTP diphosphatase [Alphaproteobacteria bacterium endosymbiont of Tiliacea citrago]|uniref:dUTP diphosphatase n=1 Tax=Alphaproteobacteria bacterium endosymbiont of Tiliacea citrago TaxID=3077944 RepID=UPI00313F3A26